ncbi:MAG TPA: amidase [Nakamurella multipartita]|nr:amidase [Nakamurella multipartita]
MTGAAAQSPLARARQAIAAHADTMAFTWIDEGADGSGPVLAVKDLVDVAGMPTSLGTAPERTFRPKQDAAVVAAFRAAGWTIVGKTNLHELALGPTSGNPHYGAVRNPVDSSRIAGGSSGGSATAVALGMADLAIGTDTGGSIRIPSSLCGTVGLRPTHGRLCLDGVWPLAPTLDTVGPMARDVRTIAEAMAGTGLLTGAATADSGPYTLARAAAWVDAVDLDPVVAAAWAAVSAGLPVLDLPPADEYVEVGLTLLYAEAAASNYEQLTVHPATMGADVRELMTRGLQTRAVDYIAALAARSRLHTAVEDALTRAGADALVIPACAITAPPLGADPIGFRDALTVFTRPFGVTGQPVVVLPAPTSGLPIGMQLIGRRGDDERLLAIAADLERRWAAL